jgi:hypothetical protein
MFELLRFIARRLWSGRLSSHPMMRRIFVVLAVIGWFRRRFPAATQRVTLRKGETLRVEVVPREKVRS